MRKNLIYIVVLALVFSIFLTGCSKKPDSVITGIPELNIYYSFGVREKNILDSRNQLYIKDMVCEPSKEYKIELSEEDKSSIYRAIIQNDLFNIKDNFTENCDWKGSCLEVSPSETATLKITIGDKTKIIKWSSNYINENDPELKKLNNVRKVMEWIISAKEQELNVKQPKCEYL